MPLRRRRPRNRVRHRAAARCWRERNCSPSYCAGL